MCPYLPVASSCRNSISGANGFQIEFFNKRVKFFLFQSLLFNEFLRHLFNRCLISSKYLSSSFITGIYKFLHFLIYFRSYVFGIVSFGCHFSPQENHFFTPPESYWSEIAHTKTSYQSAGQ